LRLERQRKGSAEQCHRLLSGHPGGKIGGNRGRQIDDGSWHLELGLRRWRRLTTREPDEHDEGDGKSETTHG
jgi:hypothetical protein